ncbi:MAG: AAA family ATPase [Fimbriimonas sp.]
MSGGFVNAVLLQRDRVPSFDVHPFSVPSIRYLSELELHPSVTYIVGENGTGKSTLVEAIAVAAGFNAEGGSKNFNFSTMASHSELAEFLTLRRSADRERNGFFLRAESFYNVASEVKRLHDEGGPSLLASYGGKSLHDQSHGESFLALIKNRFGPNSLYLLDEPESALSPSRQLALLKLIHECVTKKACQFIIATHSPILMSYPESTMYLLDENATTTTTWQETEHYQLTKAFLDHPRAFLRHLLE